ncbi:hypothetical protein BLOT_007604 [Blomia tropicalis]|nr:hypothetical protein BLOT_007604 [Blomia tropicalis]
MFNNTFFQFKGSSREPPSVQSGGVIIEFKNLKGKENNSSQAESTTPLPASPPLSPPTPTTIKQPTTPTIIGEPTTQLIRKATPTPTTIRQPTTPTIIREPTTQLIRRATPTPITIGELTTQQIHKVAPTPTIVPPPPILTSVKELENVFDLEIQHSINDGYRRNSIRANGPDRITVCPSDDGCDDYGD